MRRTLVVGMAVWAVVAWADEEVLTARKVIRNMQEALAGVQTYRAVVTINVEDGKRKSSMQGRLILKRPDRMILRFLYPAEQVIYSDGKVMKVYLPHLRLMAEQRIPQSGGGEGQDAVLLAGSGGGFQQLLRQYNWSYAATDTQTSGGRKYHIVRLHQKNVYSGFRTIDLWVTERWLVAKAVGTTREGRVVTVTFSDIVLNSTVGEGEFELNLPVDIQTVYDPFLQPERR